MKINAFLHNLQVFMRAQSIVAEIQLRHILARTSLRFMAGMVACFGLLMLDVAGYFALEAKLGSANAAALLGCGNLLVALMILVASNQLKLGKEIDIARDVQETSLNVVMSDIERVQSNLSSIVKNPLDTALSGVIGHLATTLIKQLKS